MVSPVALALVCLFGRVEPAAESVRDITLIGGSLKGISAREDQQILSPISSLSEEAILATEV